MSVNNMSSMMMVNNRNQGLNCGCLNTTGRAEEPFSSFYSIVTEEGEGGGERKNKGGWIDR